MAIDYLGMIFVLCFLSFEIIYKARILPINERFFDIKNSTAMRGFGCLIVVLVHVPEMYQNKIQDMIGSFAYIGVTFFFLTSAYGLTLSLDKKHDNIRFFWRRRLPKLLIIPWLVSIFARFTNSFLFHDEMTIKGLFGIDG